jgi:hypothetical protein
MTAGARVFLWSLLAAALGVSGCADLERKFVRKKPSSAGQPLFGVEPERLSHEQYYRQRYLYWQSWHAELVKDLGGNQKRVAQDLLEARRHLAALPKYLEDPKASELRPHIDQFSDLTEALLARRLSPVENGMMARRLERLQRRIERGFSPSDVKPFLKPDSSPIDLSPYGADEELPLPSALTPEKPRT